MIKTKIENFSIFLTLILWICFPQIGCQKNSGVSHTTSILSSDETADAGELVKEANVELKEVKKIYKANESRVEDLQKAIENKEIDKVKEISDELVLQINNGLVSAKSAIEKIEKAESMNINDSYKEYLQMKRIAILKQIEAFENRRQAAQLLRDAYGNKNPQEVEKVKNIVKEKEYNFQKLMQEGGDESKEADDLAKESVKKVQ